MNYYELLEISPKASPAVIRAAYKSLMQRYHPDKNPNDQKVAEMATLLTQAFELLSDDAKRAAYDRKLEADVRRRGSRSRTPAAKAPHLPRAAGVRRTIALVSVAAAAALTAGWWVASSPKPPAAAALPTPAAAIRPPATVSRDVAKLLSDVVVTLRDKEPASDRKRILAIPSLGVRVGARDPEGAIRHLRNTAEVLRERLQQDLAEARYEDLIKPDGERYLADIILNAVRTTTGTPEPSGAGSGDTESGERYGPVEVLLPQSFSVQ